MHIYNSILVSTQTYPF
uniref:Putative disease resistance protein RGA4 n=1 Tax=Rhizophora mucronata TaxID=61149 RepID=A0A2P2JV91_RHIMU